MDAERERQLQELIDEREIRRVIMLYCRGVDRRDRELIENTFHPDAICNDVDGMGAPTGQKRADVLVNPNNPMYFHFIGNEVIDIHADKAKAEFYFMSVFEFSRDGRPYMRMRGGRYIGRLERREGKWKFSHRISTDDWSRVDRILEQPDVHPPKGLPSAEDPVYKI